VILRNRYKLWLLMYGYRPYGSRYFIMIITQPIYPYVIPKRTLITEHPTLKSINRLGHITMSSSYDLFLYLITIVSSPCVIWFPDVETTTCWSSSVTWPSLRLTPPWLDCWSKIVCPDPFIWETMSARVVEFEPLPFGTIIWKGIRGWSVIDCVNRFND